MATLTGFKAVGDGSQQTPNGQPNPVFVFDEASDETDRNEEFLDAQSVISSGKRAIGEQAGGGGGENGTELPLQDGAGSGATVAIEMSSARGSSPTGSLNQVSPRGFKQYQNSSRADARRSANSKTKPATTATLTTTTMGQLSASENSYTLSTGKSPQTPRRSPLMALFRGKPRESTRRTYTDEDQFEIEWANLSLAVQKKWYQKISLSNLLRGDGGDDKNNSSSNNNSSSDLEKQALRRPKRILNSVDGRIKSGEITAVLGPSGAGKTSLLNSLFGKYRTAVQGSIKVTGAPSKKHLTVCTIPQSDYLIGYLTTEESLWFASRLKNTEHDFDHNKNIERVIELLGLQRCRNTRINKLSGGQYKRVSIAQEMLSSPDILVLDEPTSGLDSLTCYRTVKVLRDLVEASKAHNLINPMSIILTIHQPHREVLDLFHSVYIMAVGGQTLYQGPPSEMEECIDKYSGTSMPAIGYNPASFMVELASEEYGRKPIDLMVHHQRKRFLGSTRHQYNNNNKQSDDDELELEQQANNQSKAASKSSGSKLSDSQLTLYALDKDKYVDVDLSCNSNNSSSSASHHHHHQSSNLYKDIDSRIMTPRSGKNSDGVFWRHVSLMSKRCFLSNARDPLLFTMRVGAHIFIPLVVAIIYGPKMGIPNGCPFYKPEINLLEYATVGLEEIQEKHDDIRVQFQNVGLHFMVYYAFGLCMLAFTAISFPLIMHVLIKEIRNGWYSLATFVVGKMIAELPLAIFLPPISVGIIYLMTGQPSSYFEWRYMVQSLILILIIMIAEAKGLIFGAICMNSMQTAVFAASVSTVPFILLSGFLIRIREVPQFLQHASKFSYFKHAVEALIITRYGFGMCPCDPALIPVDGTPRIIGVPAQIMSLTDYYINAYAVPPENSTTSEGNSGQEETNIVGNNRTVSRVVRSATYLSAEIVRVDRSAGGQLRARRAASGDNSTTTEQPTTTSEPTTIITTEESATTIPPSPDTLSTTTTEPTTTTTTAAAATTTTVATSTSAVRNEPKSAKLEEASKEEEEGESEEVEKDKPQAKQGIFFDKLATLLTRANAFGFSIKSCNDVEPFTMKDMQLTDSQLPHLIGYLFLYIVILKFISYFIVEICVKLKL